MKLTTLILALAAGYPLTSAGGGGFNENVLSCKNKDLKGDCEFISLTHRLDTCIDVPDPSGAKYGDKGSSFQINGRMACRFFRTAASLGCKDPSVDPKTGMTGKDSQRATGWIANPGVMDWQGCFKFQSFMCTSTDGKTMEQLPKVVVAECMVDDQWHYSCKGDEAVP